MIILCVAVFLSCASASSAEHINAANALGFNFYVNMLHPAGDAGPGDLPRLEMSSGGVQETPSTDPCESQACCPDLAAQLDDIRTRLSTLESAANQSDSVPECESLPSVWTPGSARPDLPACAKTCLQLRRAGDDLADGVYWLRDRQQPVWCDLSRDGGGWTLLLTAASRTGWDLLNVRSRNPATPSLLENYSILGQADSIKALGTGNRFAYRIEAQTETGRGQWGGVWLAPRHYTLTPETDNQRDIVLARKFGTWEYGKPSLQKTVPWINTDNYLDGRPILTTTHRSSADWWGTLLTRADITSYNHSPWIHGAPNTSTGVLLYWLREEEQ